MKKNISNIFSALIVSSALMLSSCDADVFNINSDPFKNETYMSMSVEPISTVLSSRPDFTEYVRTLQYSGMYNALNQSSNGISFTAFAPNNEAMNEFYQRRGKAALEDFTPEYMRQFVLFHTVKENITQEQFINRKTVTNLVGDDVTVTIDAQHAGQALLNEEAQIIAMGDSAANGSIYTLSRALTPLVETIYDRLKENGSSAIMLQALEQTGWAKKLNTVRDTVVLNGANVVTQRFYTLLNVTDGVFAKVGINSLDGLKQKLQQENSREDVSADSLLREYVGYHILPNSLTMDAMGGVTGGSVTKIIGTSAKNQVMTVTTDTTATVVSNRYMLNAAGEAATAEESGSDILARNGYMHNLTAWLPVWAPQQETVVWDFADNAEVKNLVMADERNTYQPTEYVSNEARTDISRATAVFNYEMGPAGTNNSSYGAIDYISCGKNWKDANNLDRVVFNVGAQGFVEITTPTIIRGKYRVVLTFAYTTSHSFMRTQSGSNGGRLILSMDDDNLIERAPYATVTSALPGMYSCELWKEITFDETAAHKFKFIVNDQAASTNKNFSLQFDTITFIPVE